MLQCYTRTVYFTYCDERASRFVVYLSLRPGTKHPIFTFTKCLYMVPMAAARFSFGGVATTYVHVYFRFHGWHHINTQWSRIGDVKRRILKMTQQGAAPDRGQSLLCTIAVFHIAVKNINYFHLLM